MSSGRGYFVDSPPFEMYIEHYKATWQKQHNKLLFDSEYDVYLLQRAGIGKQLLSLDKL